MFLRLKNNFGAEVGEETISTLMIGVSPISDKVDVLKVFPAER